ncbi:la-related protein 4 [Mytilus galloprovincialis]|uniref:La-related protein 4 n=1 Tax=Mytilus galloprovincialis TaxID=29158 RepID=A0A8B6GKT7_MYTGA|nr:la-related protein 4 [Mytilus galloprovincialis]
MTSDRGTTGGAELTTTPVQSADYLVQWDGSETVLQFEKPGLNPNATVYKPADVQWDVNVNEYKYTNGDVGTGEGGAVTPTQTPLPEAPLDNAMGYNYEPNHNLDNGEDPLAGMDAEERKRHMIKTQLEACLSRENLASDRYLQSQMDADQYVPIATVAQLDQISQLTKDLELIIELIKELPNVQVHEDGEKCRPNHNRCTVILREIPDDTPLDDVKGLFTSEKCPKFASCEFAHNSNWFVTFESDADAQSAYQYLREEVKTFLGKPIMARIKAKPLIKNTPYPRNGYNRYQQQQNQQQQQQQQQAQQQQQLIQQPQQQQAQQQQQQQPTEGQGPQQTPQFQVQPQVSLMSNMSNISNIPNYSQQVSSPQFQVQPQVSLMSNMSNIPNYSQQAIPFFPNPMIQWPNNPLMDPSMVLAINGYQATSVKLNTQPRTPFGNLNRNNRNPRQNNRLGNQDRGPLDNRPSHDRQPQSHRTSPRMSDNQPISGHHSYQSQSRRTLDNNANHSHMSPVIDNNNIPAGRQSEIPSRYKSRRKPPLNGGPKLNNMKDKPEPQFDFESSNFPPLGGGPGTTSASTSSTSNEVFESKLSDVVKGTAKPQAKPQTNASQPQPVSPVAPPRPATPPQQPQKDHSNNSSSAINGTSAISSQSSTPTRVPSPPPVSPQKSQKTAIVEPPQQQKVIEVVQTPVKVTPVSSTPVKTAERERATFQTDRERPSPAKLSYAQMVQRKGSEKEEGSGAEGKPDDLSDNSGNESPQCSRKTLKEQSQTQKPAPRTPSKEHGRREFEPKEQRHGGGRRPAKENRIDRRGDRRRSDRNDREGSRSSVSSAK